MISVTIISRPWTDVSANARRRAAASSATNTFLRKWRTNSWMWRGFNAHGNPICSIAASRSAMLETAIVIGTGTPALRAWA